ncbi:MAG TPA: ATP-binding protein [Acidobacteriaceae bacterium]|nr:ATP-binding protein [Acidobacteriaceae bacterium]
MQPFTQKHTPGPARTLVRYAALTTAALLLVLLFRTVARVNETTVALSFLMLVMVTASRWRLQYSVYLSVLCTLLYNFFFLPPIGRLTIEDPRNWVALTAFLACSVLVSHLSNQEHRQADAAEQRRREVERLYEFSQQLLLQDDPRRLARAAPSAAAAVFGFRAVALYVRDDNAVFSSDPANELISAAELKLTASQGESATMVREGCRIIPLSLGMRSPGVLAVSEAGYSPQIYEAIGSLVAIALERAGALERSSRLEASREGERLRSTLLDSVTHDLRTPLTAIRAAVTTLVSAPELPEPEQTELLSVVDEESARLDRLIGQAVEMAELDADAVKVHHQPQDVQALMETTVEELQPLLRGRRVELQAPDDLPRVPMDRELVGRALRHVLENAVRYSAPDSRVVLAAARESDRLLLTVTDQGPGIDPAEQLFVFDKFYRGRQYRASIKGSGMGLAIAKAILEAHGGGITLASSPGQGSRFTLWLPLAASRVEEKLLAD